MVDCECIHPLYTDFDHLRHQKIGNKSIAEMKVCNLIQGGMNQKTLSYVNNIHSTNYKNQ